LQIVRVDQQVGWDDDLFVAWEAWSESRPGQTDVAPQVALRDWSQPTKLVWESAHETGDGDTSSSGGGVGGGGSSSGARSGGPGQTTFATFSDAADADAPRDFCVGMSVSRRPGRPLLCSLYAKHVLKNLTGEDVEVIDSEGHSVVV
jgi:hypothetical protein